MLRYNILFILAQALALVGAYALARQLGVGRIGARRRRGRVRGRAVAAGPGRAPARPLHRRDGARAGHAGPRPRRPLAPRGRRASADRRRAKPGLGASPAGWSPPGSSRIGFGVGLLFVYVLLRLRDRRLSAVGGRCRRRPCWPGRRRLLLADGAGGGAVRGVALMMAQPYLKVLELYPYAKRDAADRRSTRRRCAACSPRRPSRCSGATCTRPRGPSSACRARWRCCPASRCTRWPRPG